MLSEIENQVLMKERKVTYLYGIDDAVYEVDGSLLSNKDKMNLFMLDKNGRRTKEISTTYKHSRHLNVDMFETREEAKEAAKQEKELEAAKRQEKIKHLKTHLVRFDYTSADLAFHNQNDCLDPSLPPWLLRLAFATKA
jgi:hypothetical protein